ncbi:GlxA family transcriptional regulator [Piscinibacter gummiphilus]|uniref:Transcriptional regulator n=1 Tax=Piscinibacter gummiphilus TaxID=946333 RepID=A0A1W6L6C4_9BURK|nr:DJ-1/PfpI family protein [Piscinibacter gummiphilus]ARN19879.1 transcriptional regulator [Piscinibacter gummiphilus]ATU64552.1 AraC family transcriptional regulator [Piscinibacter gummiphilus]GLS95036.1 transcriptional regulator [Piscinibacter gummiphilus]
MATLHEPDDPSLGRDRGPRHDGGAVIPATADVVLLAFDGVEVIDVAGPASVFSKAEALHPGRYRLHVASPAGGPVATNSGLSLGDTRALAALPAAVDTIIVAGGDEPAMRSAIVDQGVARWLRQAAPRARRMASVCSGAFALAAAGLLDGREATTHWRVCDLLQALRPQATVLRERIYVRDGPVWTSAGVTTGIELALALVEEDLGHDLAMDIARTLALPMLRGADQPQLSAALEAQAGASHRLRDLLAWIDTNLDADLSVDALAERVSMSPRHFARAFVAETGSTPARFVADARVTAASRLLDDSGWPQERIASRCGFGSVDALQRAFARRHGVTPQAWRRRSA